MANFTIRIPDQVVTEDPDMQKYLDTLQQMVDRMAVSHFKYGNMADKYPHSYRSIDTARQRMTLYDGKNQKESCDCEGYKLTSENPQMHTSDCFLRRKAKTGGDGNTEHLLDAANQMIIEHLFPSHQRAHFEAQTSKQSPGLVPAVE